MMRDIEIGTVQKTCWLMSWVLPSDDVQDIGDCHQTLRKILLLSKFPEIGAPQNHPFLNMFMGFPTVNHPAMGVSPMAMETPNQQLKLGHCWAAQLLQARTWKVPATPERNIRDGSWMWISSWSTAISSHSSKLNEKKYITSYIDINDIAWISSAEKCWKCVPQVPLYGVLQISLATSMGATGCCYWPSIKSDANPW